MAQYYVTKANLEQWLERMGSLLEPDEEIIVVNTMHSLVQNVLQRVIVTEDQYGNRTLKIIEDNDISDEDLEELKLTRLDRSEILEKLATPFQELLPKVDEILSLVLCFQKEFPNSSIHSALLGMPNQRLQIVTSVDLENPIPGLEEACILCSNFVHNPVNMECPKEIQEDREIYERYLEIVGSNYVVLSYTVDNKKRNYVLQVSPTNEVRVLDVSDWVNKLVEIMSDPKTFRKNKQTLLDPSRIAIVSEAKTLDQLNLDIETYTRNYFVELDKFRQNYFGKYKTYEV